MTRDADFIDLAARRVRLLGSSGAGAGPEVRRRLGLRLCVDQREDNMKHGGPATQDGRNYGFRRVIYDAMVTAGSTVVRLTGYCQNWA